DRWDRVSTMVRSDAARAVLAAGFAGMSFVPLRDLPDGLWLAVTYLVVFCLTGMGQFFAPARFALTGDVVPGDADRARAAGLAGAATSAAGIIGPPVAAPLMFAAGVHWALAANAVSYAVSSLAVRSVRLQVSAPARAPAGAGLAGLAADFTDGLQAFRE